MAFLPSTVFFPSKKFNWNNVHCLSTNGVMNSSISSPSIDCFKQSTQRSEKSGFNHGVVRASNKNVEILGRVLRV
ncbi:hypothetical protein ACHQM5_025678 [Ranunculus cassubicifolius]